VITPLADETHSERDDVIPETSDMATVNESDSATDEFVITPLVVETHSEFEVIPSKSDMATECEDEGNYT